MTEMSLDANANLSKPVRELYFKKMFFRSRATTLDPKLKKDMYLPPSTQRVKAWLEFFGPFSKTVANRDPVYTPAYQSNQYFFNSRQKSKKEEPVEDPKIKKDKLKTVKKLLSLITNFMFGRDTDEEVQQTWDEGTHEEHT